jgi:hypothetical protein
MFSLLKSFLIYNSLPPIRFMYLLAFNILQISITESCDFKFLSLFNNEEGIIGVFISK